MMEKNAFLSGFREGFSAPFAIFADQERSSIEPFVKIKTNVGDIASDWKKLGEDMNNAMRYVATTIR